MLKEIFASVLKYSILHKERKINKPNTTADQVVDMQAVNFVLMKHNYFFDTIDKRFFIQ